MSEHFPRRIVSVAVCGGLAHISCFISWAIYASANTLIRKFARCSQHVKVILVESYCCNFYCGSLWNDLKKRCFYKLKVAYNNVFRKLLGFSRRESASQMFVQNIIDTFDARIRKSCFKFRTRLLTCTNNIILATNTHTWISNNYMWLRWQNLLHSNGA